MDTLGTIGSSYKTFAKTRGTSFWVQISLTIFILSCSNSSFSNNNPSTCSAIIIFICSLKSTFSGVVKSLIEYLYCLAISLIPPNISAILALVKSLTKTPTVVVFLLARPLAIALGR